MRIFQISINNLKNFLDFLLVNVKDYLENFDNEIMKDLAIKEFLLRKI